MKAKIGILWTGLKSVRAVLVMLLVTPLLSSCFFPEQVVRNIRVIAKAEVGGKVVEGTTVISQRWQAGSNGRMYQRRRSEALIMDLAGRGTVYVLDGFDGKNGTIYKGFWAFEIQNALGIFRRVKIKDFPAIESAEGRYSMPIKNRKGRPGRMPVMVTFGDESRMETMKRVRPGDFPRFFGSDVRFLGISFEFTNDPPSELIAKRLPIAVKVNKSYYSAFPKEDTSGKRLIGNKQAFPYQVGYSAFIKRSF